MMQFDTMIFNEGRKLPVVEEFYSIQGEGFHFGKAAYFLRIGGCDVGCSWCDTKFSWNPNIHPVIEVSEILERIYSCPAKAAVITGGEPLLFDMEYLCSRLKRNGIQTFLETSGSHPISGTWDWICLSPKKQYPPREEIFPMAGELKVIICDKEDFLWAEECSQKVNSSCLLYLQPEWSVYDRILPQVVDYIKENPSWKISLQAHKFMHIP